MSKECYSCGIEKPLTKFKYFRNKKYGRSNVCRSCEYTNYKAIIIKKYGQSYWDKCVFDNFKDRIRSRTRAAFRRIKENKPTKTENLLGCDWVVAKEHIETFFNDYLDWDNFNEWHIDHIVPLCSAKTIDELTPLCKYTNLQPLLSRDNLIKGGRY
jgi:hypothetical protein